MSTIEIKTATVERTAGSCLRGEINTTYRQLVHTFGPPTLMGDMYKMDAEWCLEIDGRVATIYNYKNGRAYLGATAPATEEITEWNIGGFDAEVEHLVKKAIDSGVRIQE